MNSVPLTYRLPNASWTFRFADNALAVLASHVQHRLASKESVGQFYTRDLATNEIVIEEATVLPPRRAAWAKVTFDVKEAMKEREAMFSRGFHCIGLWHTHPESRPSPSYTDRNLARDHALAAKPQLAGLLFAILGTLPLPTGLRVWIDDGALLQEAEALSPPGGSWLCEGNVPTLK